MRVCVSVAVHNSKTTGKKHIITLYLVGILVRVCTTDLYVYKNRFSCDYILNMYSEFKIDWSNFQRRHSLIHSLTSIELSLSMNGTNE